mgnify:CR=1 FL=1
MRTFSLFYLTILVSFNTASILELRPHDKSFNSSKAVLFSTTTSIKSYGVNLVRQDGQFLSLLTASVKQLIII